MEKINLKDIKNKQILTITIPAKHGLFYGSIKLLIDSFTSLGIKHNSMDMYNHSNNTQAPFELTKIVNSKELDKEKLLFKSEIDSTISYVLELQQANKSID